MKKKMNKKKMKKMTNEEKAKAYDEALDRFKEWASGTCEQSVNNSPKDIAEFIFPQLAESDDERIREKCIHFLELQKAHHADTSEIDECISYLEKKKEQKPAVSREEILHQLFQNGSITLSDYLYLTEEQKPAEPSSSNNESEYDRGYRDGKAFQLKQVEQYSIGKTFMGLIPCWVNAPSTLQPAHKYHGKNAVIMHENNGGFMCCFIDDEEATVAHLPENTGFVEGWRKKPAWWSKEDEAMIKSILFVLESYVSQSESASSPSLITTYPTYYKEIDWLKSLRPQSKQEWSEEDERILKGIIGLIDHDQHYGVSNNEMISWLKSLRPQLKVEWSEEDADMLNCCISSIEEAKENRYAYKETDGDTSYDREIDWLKSLRSHKNSPIMVDADQLLKILPPPSWKPSEDEVRLINTSISFLKDFADKGYENAVECIDWLKSKLNGNTCK